MFRDFIPEDREAYLTYSKTFYRSDAVLHTIPAENFETTFDMALKGSPFMRGLMILQDGQPAGYALLSFTYSCEIGGLVVLLEEAYIEPSFQGRGIGSDLLRFVEEEYRGKAHRLRLEVTKANAGAIRLYERMGYQRLDYVQMIKDTPW